MEKTIEVGKLNHFGCKPSIYDGQQYRSLVEARWAQWIDSNFDSWAYEDFRCFGDLRGLPEINNFKGLTLKHADICPISGYPVVTPSWK